MDIDLRQEIDDLLVHNGYDIEYYRRTNLPCSVCKLEDEAQAPPTETCKDCLGTGQKLQKEIKRVRCDPASIPETWPRAIQRRPVGNWKAPAWLYFMKHDANPKSLDLIIDMGRILEINFVDGQRRWDGRIEYYYVATEAKPTKIQHMG